MIKQQTLAAFYNAADREALLEGLDPGERARVDEAAAEALEAGFEVMPRERAERLVEKAGIMRYEQDIFEGEDGERYGVAVCNGGIKDCASVQLPLLEAPPADSPMARDGLAKALERVQQVWEEEIGALVERERERLGDPSIEALVQIRDDGLYLAFGPHHHHDAAGTTP